MAIQHLLLWFFHYLFSTLQVDLSVSCRFQNKLDSLLQHQHPWQDRLFGVLSASNRICSMVRFYAEHDLSTFCLCTKSYSASNLSISLLMFSIFSVGSKRATTCPFLLMRNFVKFHLMSDFSLYFGSLSDNILSRIGVSL